MTSPYRPELSHAGLDPTIAVHAFDEYQNCREMHIANEQALTVYIDSYEIVTLMTLGTHPEYLTLGYIKNQGLVKNITDIQSVQVEWQVNAAAVSTNTRRDDWQEKLGPRIVTTGCGQGTVYGDILENLERLSIKPIPLKQSGLYALLKNLNAYNDVYKNAGAVHGCALCSGDDIEVFIEDVGRHNAVDAIAGKMWLENISGKNKIFYTTGRLTSEMVLKVAQMQIPVLLSRSGITQMGLKLAQDTGVTLISRAKGQHFMVYHGSEHIEYDVSLPDKKQVSSLVKK